MDFCLQPAKARVEVVKGNLDDAAAAADLVDLIAGKSSWIFKGAEVNSK
jgi:hypothetical protein